MNLKTRDLEICPGKTRDLVKWAEEFLAFAEPTADAEKGAQPAHGAQPTHGAHSTQSADSACAERCAGSAQTPSAENMAKVLCDPQTSGGLLIALEPAQAKRYLELCPQRDGCRPVVIGHVVALDEGTDTAAGSMASNPAGAAAAGQIIVEA